MNSLDDLIYESKDKLNQLNIDKQSMGPLSDDCEYIIERYKASMEYIISKLERSAAMRGGKYGKHKKARTLKRRV